MKIVQLEYFCAVSRCKSITQAAQKLYVTQPAISNAIRELEKEYSITLFTRSKNRLTLTKEGELFYEKANELLQSIEQASLQLYDLGKLISPIRIGIPPMLSTIFFPKLLLAFQEQYPDVPVELFEYGAIRAAVLLQENALDLAFMNLDCCDTRKVHVQQILTDQMVFCVSKQHPLAKEKELSIEQLKDVSLIMYHADSVQNTTINTLFERSGITPKIILHASQLYTIKNFISNNLGGAFLYPALLHDQPDLVDHAAEPIEQEIGLVWKKAKYIKSSVEKFISFTSEYFKKMPPG